jgi:hypothetical protein
MHALLNNKLFIINFYRKHKEHLSSSGNQNAIQIDKLFNILKHNYILVVIIFLL